MSKKPGASRRKSGREPRHRFILNPHAEVRCSRCPRCEALMKVRKIPLLIQIEPDQLITLRKTAKLCPACDLLIVHQDELEQELAFAFQSRRPEIIGNPYMVLGTVDVADWKEAMKEPGTPAEIIAKHHPFKEVLELHVSPGGWFPADAVPDRPAPRRRRQP